MDEIIANLLEDYGPLTVEEIKEMVAAKVAPALGRMFKAGVVAEVDMGDDVAYDLPRITDA